MDQNIEHSKSPEDNEPLIPPGVQFDHLTLLKQREAIHRALKRYCGNREKAAAALGLGSRFQLYRLMVKLGIEEPE